MRNFEGLGEEGRDIICNTRYGDTRSDPGRSEKHCTILGIYFHIYISFCLKCRARFSSETTSKASTPTCHPRDDWAPGVQKAVEHRVAPGMRRGAGRGLCEHPVPSSAVINASAGMHFCAYIISGALIRLGPILLVLCMPKFLRKQKGKQGVSVSRPRKRGGIPEAVGTRNGRAGGSSPRRASA